MAKSSRAVEASGAVANFSELLSGPALLHKSIIWASKVLWKMLAVTYLPYTRAAELHVCLTAGRNPDSGVPDGHRKVAAQGSHS